MKEQQAKSDKAGIVNNMVSLLAAIGFATSLPAQGRDAESNVEKVAFAGACAGVLAWMVSSGLSLKDAYFAIPAEHHQLRHTLLSAAVWGGYAIGSLSLAHSGPLTDDLGVTLWGASLATETLCHYLSNESHFLKAHGHTIALIAGGLLSTASAGFFAKDIVQDAVDANLHGDFLDKLGGYGEVGGLAFWITSAFTNIGEGIYALREKWAGEKAPDDIQMKRITKKSSILHLVEASTSLGPSVESTASLSSREESVSMTNSRQSSKIGRKKSISQISQSTRQSSFTKMITAKEKNLDAIKNERV